MTIEIGNGIVILDFVVEKGYKINKEILYKIASLISIGLKRGRVTYSFDGITDEIIWFEYFEEL